MKVWFRVAEGKHLFAAACIRRDGITDVDDLRTTVVQAFPGRMEGVAWPVLKVYKDVEAFKKGKSMDVDAPIESFGATRAKALVVQVPKIWFQLVAADTGAAFAGTSADAVPLADTQSVNTLKNEVKKKYADSHLNGVAASDLKVYAFRGAAAPMVGEAEIGSIGREETAPVLVVVPQRAPMVRQVAPVKWNLVETEVLPLQFGDKPLILVPEKYTRGSGLGAGDLLLYRRPELVQEWRAFQKCVIDSHALLWIVGPPGTGKSSAAFAFACSLDRPSVWSVVWISCPKEGEVMSCIYFSGNREKLECRVHSSQLSSLLDSLEGRIILFLDGYVDTRDNHGVLAACLFWRDQIQTHHRFVCVCSMVTRGKAWHHELHTQIRPAKTKDEASVPAINVMIPTIRSRPAKTQELFRLMSWTLENYQDALGNDSILKHVKTKFTTSTSLVSPVERLKLLVEKYAVVGGSARLMFDASTEEAVETLLQAINTAQDIETYVNNKLGLAFAGAVSRLFSWYHKPGEVLPQPCILSKFVARELAVRLGPDYVENIAKSLRRNPSMEDYSFELWFFATLTHNVVVCFRGGVEHCGWTSASLLKIDPRYGIPVDVASQWFVPQSWTQEGYDAVFVETNEADAEGIAKEGYARNVLVRFVRISRTETQLFNPERFCSLLSLLDLQLRESDVRTRLEAVELYYVVPNSIQPIFRPPVSSQQFVADVLSSALKLRRDGVVSVPTVEISVVGVNWDGGRQS